MLNLFLVVDLTLKHLILKTNETGLQPVSRPVEQILSFTRVLKSTKKAANGYKEFLD